MRSIAGPLLSQYGAAERAVRQAGPVDRQLPRQGLAWSNGRDESPFPRGAAGQRRAGLRDLPEATGGPAGRRAADARTPQNRRGIRHGPAIHCRHGQQGGACGSSEFAAASVGWAWLSSRRRPRRSPPRGRRGGNGDDQDHQHHGAGSRRDIQPAERAEHQRDHHRQPQQRAQAELQRTPLVRRPVGIGHGATSTSPNLSIVPPPPARRCGVSRRRRTWPGSPRPRRCRRRTRSRCGASRGPRARSCS